MQDEYAAKPNKKRVDRKSTPVGFDFDTLDIASAMARAESSSSQTSEKKKHRSDPDSIISPAHPKWNRTLDLRLRELVSQLGTLSWKAVCVAALHNRTKQ